MFPTENIVNSNENAIAGQERIVIGQVDESSYPMAQKAKLLEFKLNT